MCIYCTTFIQLNEYWITTFGLDIHKKHYISIDNWATLIGQKSFTIKDMNNVIKDLHLENEVSLIDEDEENENKWIQRNQFFDYCLKNGGIGNIIPTEVMDKIIDSGDKSTRVKFLNCTQTAYETY